MEIKYLKLSDIRPYANNPRKNAKAVDKVVESFKKFGFHGPILIDKNNEIICGHTRYKAAKKLKMTVVPTICLDNLTDAQVARFRILDNKVSEFSKWDEDLLQEELSDLIPDFKMDIFGFKNLQPDDKLNEDKNSDVSTKKNFTTTRQQVDFTPSSVIERGSEYNRIYEYWKDLGIIKSDGRISDLLGDNKGSMAKGMGMEQNGTSVFNPVVCELMYRWFSKEDDLVFDPFAGGYTRGIVATMLKREYVGIDLRQEQVDADVSKAEELELSPTYICDDSQNADAYIKDGEAGMIMTCPPYYDLEKYSDDERDLSHMKPDEFLDAYRNILEISARKLKQNGFFVIVVGEVRDKKRGYYREFVSDTVRILTNRGLYYWDEIILVNTPGTTAASVRGYFEGNRKIGSIHQNILVFYKGNPQEIADNWEEVDI